MPTNRIEVTDTAWADLGAGPLYFHLGQVQNLRLHFAGSAPDLETPDFIAVGGPSGHNYDGTERVYARATTGTSHVVVVTEPA